MYYQSYEEYMRDVLGYPKNSQIPTSTYNNLYGMEQQRRSNAQSDNEAIKKMYPEIYKITYPMVCKACNQYRGEITEEFINNLTEEVYSNLEIENIEFAKANLEARTSNNTKNAKNSGNLKNEAKKVETEKRNSNDNNILRDLIKILIIRELLNMQQRPGRPPFPGIPPFPGGQNPRPPMPRVSQMLPYDIGNNEMPGYYGNIY